MTEERWRAQVAAWARSGLSCKLAVVLDAQGLAEEQLGGFLRQRGLRLATLGDWRETVLRLAPQPARAGVRP